MNLWKPLFLFVAFSAPAFAVDPAKVNLAPPGINTDATNMVDVKQSDVQLHGRRYRRIEYKGENFYLRLQTNEEATDSNQPNSADHFDTGKDSHIDCLKTNTPLSEDSARVQGEIKVTQFTSVYLEALHNECVNFDPRYGSDGFLGVKLATGKNSNINVGVEARSIPVANPNTGSEAKPVYNVNPKANLNFNF